MHQEKLYHRIRKTSPLLFTQWTPMKKIPIMSPHITTTSRPLQDLVEVLQETTIAVLSLAA